MRRHDRGARVARGAVAASLATFVALVSHVSAGGAVPGPVGIVVPLALSFVVCVALAGRRLSAWRLGLSVAVSQALFHALFVLGSFDLGAGVHAHGGAIPVVTGGSSAPAFAMDADMAVGHLVAVVVTTLALHRGRDACHRRSGVRSRRAEPAPARAAARRHLADMSVTRCTLGVGGMPFHGACAPPQNLASARAMWARRRVRRAACAL